jgi:hypothetical protein
MKTEQTHVTCAVATASGFVVPYSSSATSRDPKGYMEKHPEPELARSSLLSKLILFVWAGSRGHARSLTRA